MCRPTIEQLRQHPWVNRDYQIAQPREPVPKAGTAGDIFEPTVNPENLSVVCSLPNAHSISAWYFKWLHKLNPSPRLPARQYPNQRS